MEKNNSEALEFVTSVNDFTVYCGRLMFSSPIWKIYPTKDWKMFLKASKHVYRYFFLRFKKNFKF